MTLAIVDWCTGWQRTYAWGTLPDAISLMLLTRLMSLPEGLTMNKTISNEWDAFEALKEGTITRAEYGFIVAADWKRYLDSIKDQDDR